MQIEVVIIIPNVRGIFDLRKKCVKKTRVGWVTSRWELIQINDKMFWKRVHDYNINYKRYTLSLDKKKIVARYYNLPTIYLDKRRAKSLMKGQFNNIRLDNIPFRKKDLK